MEITDYYVRKFKENKKLKTLVKKLKKNKTDIVIKNINKEGVKQYDK